MNPDEVIKAVREMALPELEQFLPALPVALPLEALLRLAEFIAKEIEAKNEKEAMQAAVNAADVAVDALEAADLALK